MRRLTKCKRLPGSMTLTTKWIRKMLCPCLKDVRKTDRQGDKCVNPTKFKLAHMQQKLLAHRPKWFVARDELERQSGPGALACSCAVITWQSGSGRAATAKACAPGSPYRSYHLDLRAPLATFSCKGPRWSEAELDEYDNAQAPIPSQLPGENKKVPFRLAHRECHREECAKCGISKSSPFIGIPVLKTELDGSGKVHSVRACEYEATGSRLVYSDFRRVLRTAHEVTSEDKADPGYNPNQKKPKTAERWVPVAGTQKSFIAEVQSTMLRYNELSYHWKYDNHVSARLKEEVLVKPAPTLAVVVERDAPASARGLPRTALVDVGFAVHQTGSKNSEIPQVANCLNSFWQFDPQLLPLEGRPGAQAKSLRAQHGPGARLVRSTNVFIYNYCGGKHNTNYFQTMQRMNTYITQRGVNPNCRTAVFDAHAKEVIPWAKGTPSWFEVPPDFVLRKASPYTKNGVDGVIVLFDGASDFAGRNNLSAMQSYAADTGVARGAQRHPAAEGKCVCDGGSTTIKALADQAVRRGGTGGSYEPSTAGYATFATKLLAKAKATYAAEGRQRETPEEHEFTHVLVSYLPDDGPAFTDFTVDQGYKGSASDYFYESVYDASDTAKPSLRVRNYMCVCKHCMRNKYHLCSAPWARPVAPQVVGAPWRNPRGSVRIAPKAAQEQRALRNGLSQFVGRLGKGTRVAARVSNADANGEEYFLAIVQGKPFRVAADGTFGTANSFKRKGHAVRLKRLYFLGGGVHGARQYELHGKEKPVVFPVEGLVHTACQHLTAAKLKIRRGKYTLDCDSNEAILAFSQLRAARVCYALHFFVLQSSPCPSYHHTSKHMGVPSPCQSGQRRHQAAHSIQF